MPHQRFNVVGCAMAAGRVEARANDWTSARISSSGQTKSHSKTEFAFQSSSTGRPDGFALRKCLADNGALVGGTGAGDRPKKKTLVRSVVLRKSANVSAPSRIPELVNEPDHTTEVLRRIADKTRRACRRSTTISGTRNPDLIAALRVGFDGWG